MMNPFDKLTTYLRQMPALRLGTRENQNFTAEMKTGPNLGLYSLCR